MEKDDPLREAREDFERKLSEQYSNLDPTNAPTGLATCPNCALAKPFSRESDKRRFLIRCQAIPIVPAFGGRVYDPQDWNDIDLALFDMSAPYAEKLNSRSCPLFVEKTI